MADAAVSQQGWSAELSEHRGSLSVCSRIPARPLLRAVE